MCVCVWGLYKVESGSHIKGLNTAASCMHTYPIESKTNVELNESTEERFCLTIVSGIQLN